MKSKIQQFREQRNMTQSALAEKSGLSLRTVQRMEAGNIPKGHTLRAVSTALNIAPEELKFTDTQNFDLNRVKLINICSLCFLVIPFGNIIVPAILISRTIDPQTKQIGNMILSIQIIWTVVLSLLMIVSPFIQARLAPQIPVFLIILVGLMAINLFIILKNAQVLNRRGALYIQLKDSML